MNNQSTKKEMPYNIGLDLGTNSIGYAVTDLQGNLLKKSNKHLWGFVKFDAAKTAQERRNYRGNRRRITRRKQRIKALQDIMSPIVLKEDPMFFKRLSLSYLNSEDRGDEYEYKNGILFDDANINDKSFYNDFPTIFHLRNELIKNTEKADPRFIYLALHNIIKNRGNFLYEGMELDLNNNDEINNKLNKISDYIFGETEIRIVFKDIIEYDCLLDKELKKTEKCEEFCNVLVSQDESLKDIKNTIKELAKAFVGSVFSVNKIFTSLESDEIKCQFSSSNFEETKEEIKNILGDDFEVFEYIEDIYNFLVLKK